MALVDVLNTLSSMGFEHVLLWLLAFAIVHGLMGQAKILEKAKETRAIIAIVAGFMVVLAMPGQLVDIISNMSAGMVLVVMGLLILVAFVEALGLKNVVYKSAGKHPQTGQEMKEPVLVGFFTQHTYIIAAVLIIVAVLIFFGSGGGALLGIEDMEITGESMTSIVLIIVVIVSVLWMIQGKDAK